MFHIEFIIDDKYLAGILRTLAEIKVQGLETKPVVNVQKKNGKLAEQHPGTLAERTAAALTKHHKSSRLTRADIFAVIRQQGGSPANGIVTDLLKAKAIRRLARGEYLVLGGK